MLNDPIDRRFLLTNRPDFRCDYDGVTLSFAKRWSQSWQALVSYTWSQAEGLIATSGLAPGDSLSAGSFASIDSYGQDPNDITNAAGKMPNDRTHMFRLSGSFEIPNIEVLIVSDIGQGGATSPALFL